MRFLIRIVITAVALWVAVHFVPGMAVLHGSQGWNDWAYLGIAALIVALVNRFVRPIVKLLSLPFYILTLGLFFLVINAAMLLLAAYISEQIHMGLSVDSFGAAFFGGIIVGLVNWVASLFIPADMK